MSRTDLKTEARKHSVIKAAILKQHPDLIAEDQVLLDTLEGASGFNDEVEKLLVDAAYAQAYATGLEAMIDDAQERRARYLRKVERLRQLLFTTMLDMGETKVTTPAFTVSIAAGQPELIVDRERVPNSYRKPGSPDLALIRKTLMDSVELPFAKLGNAKPYLKVSSK